MEPKPLITIVNKDECLECGGKMVALRIPLQISRLNEKGEPIKWDTLATPLEEYRYCPKCKNMIPIKCLGKQAPDGVRMRNPFGYL